MNLRYIAKYLSCLLLIQVLSYKAFPSIALAQYTKILEVCSNDSNLFYGFSDEECHKYRNYEREEKKRRFTEAAYLLKEAEELYETDRYMQSAIVYEKFLSVAGDNLNYEGQAEVKNTINSVVRYCKSYADYLNQKGTNNILNGAIGFIDALNNNYSYRQGVRNMADVVQTGRERKTFLRRCTFEE